MNLNLSFRHMDSTDAIKEKIEQKVQHLSRLIPVNSTIDWTCSIDGKTQKSDVFIHAHGNQFHAQAEDENLYKTFDSAIQKLEAQIRKLK